MSQGLPLAYAQELCRRWAEDYDFGFAERLNIFPQYRDTVDGLGIHFLDVRSPQPDAFATCPGVAFSMVARAAGTRQNVVLGASAGLDSRLISPSCCMCRAAGGGH